MSILPPALNQHQTLAARTAMALVLACLLAAATVVPALAGFQPQQTYPTGSRPISVATADLNGDGKLDLAIANSNATTVSVLLGNGDGTFQPQQTLTAGARPQSIVVADLNGDGTLDIAVANQYGATVSVFLGNGNGTFQAQQTFASGTGPISLAVADLNGDGIFDLAAANYDGDTVSVLLGYGNGTFQAPQSFATGGYPFFVAIADLNGDGKRDLVVANSVGTAVSVLRGNGNGAFQAQQTFTSGSSPGSVAIADLNGDGKLDLAVANIDGNSVSVLLGYGNGTFQAPQTYPTGTQPVFVAVSDLNGDGKPDLAVATFLTPVVGVRLGNGDGTFQAQQTFPTGTSPAALAIADFNADGRPDLAVANFNSNNLGILLGNPAGALQFSSPTFTSGEGGGTASVTLTRTGSADGQISAIVSASSGAAVQGADFTFATPQTVTWADGESATKTVAIPIVQDQVDEAAESFGVAVSLPANRFGATLGAQTTATVTITDDDPLVLSIADRTLAEGQSGTTNATFIVTRGGATEQTVTVEYATSDGSAKAGQDYTATSGTLTFAPNETTKTITVPILADTVAEPDESFTVTLSNPTNATLLVAQATGTIQNDDVVVACGPRPRVTQTLTAGGGALAVHVESSALNTPANNPLQRIQFGTLQNATVTLNGQPVTSGQTVTLTPGVVLADFTVRRVTAGQPTTVPFTVVDACGEWPTFVGGGASAGF